MGQMPLTSINIYTLKLVRVTSRFHKLEKCRLTCPLACYKTIQAILNLQREPVEKFGIITLNAKNKILGLHVIAVGSLDTVIVEPREVFKAALLNNARSIIAFHNHPSGDPTPSPEDIRVTNRLKRSGEILGINLIDHIITGEKGYVSMKELGRV